MKTFTFYILVLTSRLFKKITINLLLIKYFSRYIIKFSIAGTRALSKFRKLSHTCTQDQMGLVSDETTTLCVRVCMRTFGVCVCV